MRQASLPAHTAVHDHDRSSSILVPEPDSAPGGPPDWWAGVRVVVLGYLALLVVMLGIGFALTHLFDTSIGRGDESVNRWFAGHRTDAWNRVTAVATWFVNTVPAIGLAALITAVLATRRRGREAAMLIVALVLELAVFLSVTFVVARPRPDVVRLNSDPSTSSFPSGHTAAATVLFVGLAIIVTCCTRKMLMRALMIVLAILGAAFVGFARVYRGMHHPSDVMFGALLGAACLYVAVLAVRAAVPRRPPALRTADETAPSPARTTAA